jgi:hypothetical protein
MSLCLLGMCSATFVDHMRGIRSPLKMSIVAYVKYT